MADLLERAASGDLTDLAGLVCPERQTALRARFDPATLLAAPSGDPEPRRFVSEEQGFHSLSLPMAGAFASAWTRGWSPSCPTPSVAGIRAS